MAKIHYRDAKITPIKKSVQLFREGKNPHHPMGEHTDRPLTVEAVIQASETMAPDANYGYYSVQALQDMIAPHVKRVSELSLARDMLIEHAQTKDQKHNEFMRSIHDDLESAIKHRDELKAQVASLEQLVDAEIADSGRKSFEIDELNAELAKLEKAINNFKEQAMESQRVIDQLSSSSQSQVIEKIVKVPEIELREVVPQKVLDAMVQERLKVKFLCFALGVSLALDLGLAYIIFR